jgi:micrococcal nuclease
MSYEYAGTIVEVLDGDTLKIDVDLGFGIIMHKMKVRLNRINSAEKNTPDGIKAKLALSEVALGRRCVIRTLKDRTEKYGRYLGEVVPEGGENLSDYMVSRGLAVLWDGQGERPAPTYKLFVRTPDLDDGELREILRSGSLDRIIVALRLRRELEERSRREIEENAASCTSIETKGGDHHGQEEGS